MGVPLFQVCLTYSAICMYPLLCLMSRTRAIAVMCNANFTARQINALLPKSLRAIYILSCNRLIQAPDQCMIVFSFLERLLELWVCCRRSFITFTFQIRLVPMHAFTVENNISTYENWHVYWLHCKGKINVTKISSNGYGNQ